MANTMHDKFRTNNSRQFVESEMKLTSGAVAPKGKWRHNGEKRTTLCLHSYLGLRTTRLLERPYNLNYDILQKLIMTTS